MTGAETMAEYLAAAFSRNRIGAEIDSGDSTFLLLFGRGELAGCLKVNENVAQTDLRDRKGLEIERIYLRKRFQGPGLAYGSATRRRSPHHGGAPCHCQG